MNINNSIVDGVKLTERTLNCKHPVIQQRIKILADLDYELLIPNVGTIDVSKPVFTIILGLYDTNILHIKKSLESVFSQKYINTEVVILDNGSSGEVRDLIWNTFIVNKNAKLIRTPENLYHPFDEDLENAYFNLLNACLFCSVGDFIYFLAADDFLSDDYTERMVALFEQNDKCCTAAPMVVSVNESGKINEASSQSYKNNNIRGKYTNGVSLAQSYMRRENLISFPGGLLSIKSDIVLTNGGFDLMCDHSQLFRFGILGDSGFDPKAKLYWRHHDAQTNKIASKMGIIFYDCFNDFLERYDIKRHHENNAGNIFANEYEVYFKSMIVDNVVNCFRNTYRFGLLYGIRIFIRIYKQCPLDVTKRVLPYFFKGLPMVIWINYIPLWMQQTLRKVKRVFLKTT